MVYSRGDIIEVPFLLSGNKTLNHPAVIISNEAVHDAENWYICIMLTSQSKTDRFTFRITDEMLVKPNDKAFAQARCHIITYALESQIIRNSNRNRMKRNHVNRLVEHVTQSALSEIDD
jgi:mRNA-degrading endonuclease toxin of MazEF toxin-antitoxin module